MRGLAVVGWIAVAFGAGAYYLTGSFATFSSANLALGAGLLAVSALRALVRAGGSSAAAFRGVVAKGVAGVLGVTALSVAAERLADASGIQFDWSFEQKFEPSPAVVGALEALCGDVRATLYADPQDPRLRSTRLLLRTLAEPRCLEVAEKRLEDAPEDEDRFEIGSSNTVVFEVGDRFETVPRPTEGAFYEALYRLRELEGAVVYVARGAGEGSLFRTDASGYSGLRETLLTEGFRLRDLVLPGTDEIPADADGLVVLAPRRALPDASLAALERYLEGGGRLVAFLEPFAESGLEAILARWGLGPAEGVVVDPASGPVSGAAPGVDVVAYEYGEHEVTRGLDATRMTFFPGARTFTLRKPEPDDQLQALVFASARSWRSDDAAVLEGAAAERPAGAREDYHPLVVAGRYPRGGEGAPRETRIVAFGDGGLASNHYLRTLYNLDLVANAVQWAVAREPLLTLRPKVAVSGRLQLPLPIQNTLTMFQSVGLLLPQILLSLGAFLWARSRSA